MDVLLRLSDHLSSLYGPGVAGTETFLVDEFEGFDEDFAPLEGFAVPADAFPKVLDPQVAASLARNKLTYAQLQKAVTSLDLPVGALSPGDRAMRVSMLRVAKEAATPFFDAQIAACAARPSDCADSPDVAAIKAVVMHVLDLMIAEASGKPPGACPSSAACPSCPSRSSCAACPKSSACAHYELYKYGFYVTGGVAALSLLALMMMR